MTELLVQFWNTVCTTGVLGVVLLAILCLTILVFFWILCRSVDEALDRFRGMIAASVKIFPDEGQTLGGRINRFMIVAVFLLTVLSLITRAPGDVIALLLNRRDEAMFLPLYFLAAFVVVCIISPAAVVKLERYALLTREPVEED